jgi:hypothetical protein
MDNFDAFGLTVPVSLDGLKLTPWGMFAFIGPNSHLASATGTRERDEDAPEVVTGYSYAGNAATTTRGPLVSSGLTPHHWETNNVKGIRRAYSSYANAYWLGLTGDVTMMDPLRVAWDFNYGNYTEPEAGFLQRTGWVFNLLVEYKMDFGVPGLVFWWGSGDDADPKNGSEQMPVIDVNNPNNGLSTFGTNGSPTWNNYENALGLNFMTGTWGIGARVRDMSFMDKVTHTLRFNFFGGRNEPRMAAYMTGKMDREFVLRKHGADFNTDNSNGVYLTTLDYGFELNFDTKVKIYDNLDMILELGYIKLMLDQSKSVWGERTFYNETDTPVGRVRGISTTDAVKAALMFRYTF